eukprot:c2588_g1_i1.p1 GENE.c2588_g1_i1~~c2588_g1_i1.p1  ORF type:complete len:163 (+),score=40.87 c2588_g1_i1:33-521(+)
MSAGQVTADVFTVLVGVLHVYIFFLETYYWRTKARKVFGTTEDFANQTGVLAANQGCYNLLFAVGIFYSVIFNDYSLKLLFLSFVESAAVFGAATASVRIVFTQGLPAFLSVVLQLFAAADVTTDTLYLLLNQVAIVVAFLVLGVIVNAHENRLKESLVANQ